MNNPDDFKREISEIVSKAVTEIDQKISKHDVIRPVSLIAVCEGVGTAFGVPFVGSVIGGVLETVYRIWRPAR